MHNVTLSRNISFQVVQVAIPIFLSFYQFNKASVKRKILFDTKYAKPGKREGKERRGMQKFTNRVTKTLQFFRNSTGKKPLSIYFLICQHLFCHFRHLPVIHMSQQRRFSFYKTSVNIHNFLRFLLRDNRPNIVT